jgi:hypothetical protein
MYAITSVNTFGSWNPKKWEFDVAVEEYFGEYSTGTVQLVSGFGGLAHYFYVSGTKQYNV